MDTSEKRFEYDIEQYLISHGYEQFNGQDKDGNWVHNRQHDVDKCIYMDVLCEFIAKTQPKEWAKYTKYYGDKAADKLYTRLEQTITNEGLISVLRNGITDMGVKLKVCYFKPESTLNETLNEQYAANILGCTRQFQYSPNNGNTIDMVLSVNGTGFADDVSAVRDAYKAQKDTRHQVDKAAADQLLEIVTNDYIKRLESVHDLLDEKSQEYWTENTESLRKILAKVVTGSEVLTDERREELERIIITYQKLSFPETPAEEIFNKENFEYHVKVFNQVLWQSDHLNVDIDVLCLC